MEMLLGVLECGTEVSYLTMGEDLVLLARGTSFNVVSLPILSALAT